MASINNFDELYSKLSKSAKRGQDLQALITGGNLCLTVGVALMSFGYIQNREVSINVGIGLWAVAGVIYVIALVSYFCMRCDTK